MAGLSQLETLQLRRLKTDLLLSFKVISHLSYLSPGIYFPPSPYWYAGTRSSTLSSHTQLYKPISKTAVHANNVFLRWISCWNSLPKHVTVAPSTGTFKKMLSHVDLSTYLIGDIYLI